MPRPMLKQPKTRQQTNTFLSAAQPQRQTQQVRQTDKMKLDRLLRKTRSKEYMEAMHKLDAGGHVHNRHKVEELIDIIRKEFPEIEMSDLTDIMLGIVSVCYLGRPYEVHTLDITGQIIEHYKSGQLLPGGLEKARSIALRGGYDFIEVYTDCCRCVSSTGAVSVVNM